MTEHTEIALPLDPDLVRARFEDRPNRFLVHARLEDGSEAACHLPDPGRLTDLLLPDTEIWLRPERGRHRKTRWTVVLARTPDGEGLVSVDTTLPNRLVGEALRAGALEEFSGWELEASEVTVGPSRFDFLLRREGDDEEPEGGPDALLLEVKSVTLVEHGEALFPDAVTARGRRHVEGLTEAIREGTYRASVLFVLQREDASSIRAAREIDPDFASALEEAVRTGVQVFGRRCLVDLDRIVLGEPLPAGP